MWERPAGASRRCTRPPLASRRAPRGCWEAVRESVRRDRLYLLTVVPIGLSLLLGVVALPAVATAFVQMRSFNAVDLGCFLLALTCLPVAAFGLKAWSDARRRGPAGREVAVVFALLATPPGLGSAVVLSGYLA